MTEDDLVVNFCQFDGNFLLIAFLYAVLTSTCSHGFYNHLVAWIDRMPLFNFDNG